MTNRKINFKKRITAFLSFFTLALIFFSLLCFSSSAWSLDDEGYMTIASGYNLQQVGYYTNDNEEITAVHIEYRVLVNGSYQFKYMWFLDSDAIYNEIISYNLSYIDMMAEDFISRWTSHGAVYSQGILKSELNILLNDFEYLYLDGFDTAYDIGYTDGYNVGTSESVSQAFQDGYNKGYTQAGTDLDGFNESLITIFSSPYYIFNEVFDFEIFGVSLASVLMFVLSVLLVGFVIRLLV